MATLKFKRKVGKMKKNGSFLISIPKDIALNCDPELTYEFSIDMDSAE